MSADRLLSILVATRNEAATIERCVRRLFAVYPTGCEVLVIDGGTDATARIVEGLARELPGLRLVRNPDDRGKGHAIAVGIREARGEVMAQIDADLQFLPEELPRLCAPVLSGAADVALGSRFMAGSVRLPGSTPPLRTLGNKAASAYASVLFGHRMTDVQAGMKAWTRATAAAVGRLSDNYSYEAELPAKALLRGLRVVDVPITTDARNGGVSSVNVLVDGIALARDITLFRLGLK